ncbi:hypothetical protein H4R34_001960 [Dimargaris verticillata]|uniref:Uncharacterized protein n=1 Tax=Dimargaris verticillata TaxID=2761393 RepID=A0A9W8B9Q6_9FUNG|nr:hypothetical protein H4R34_001960 [Dimargaris verticillata]
MGAVSKTDKPSEALLDLKDALRMLGQPSTDPPAPPPPRSPRSPLFTGRFKPTKSASPHRSSEDKSDTKSVTSVTAAPPFPYKPAPPVPRPPTRPSRAVADDSDDSFSDDDDDDRPRPKKGSSGMMELAAFLKDTEPPPGFDSTFDVPLASSKGSANDAGNLSSGLFGKPKKSKVFSNLRGFTTKLNFSRNQPKPLAGRSNLKATASATSIFNLKSPMGGNDSQVSLARSPLVSPALGARTGRSRQRKSSSRPSSVADYSPSTGEPTSAGPTPTTFSSTAATSVPATTPVGDRFTVKRHSRSLSHSGTSTETKSLVASNLSAVQEEGAAPAGFSKTTDSIPRAGQSARSLDTAAGVVPLGGTTLGRSRTWKLPNSARQDVLDTSDAVASPKSRTLGSMKTFERQKIFLRNFAKYDPSKNISRLPIAEFDEAELANEQHLFTPPPKGSGRDPSLDLPRMKPSKSYPAPYPQDGTSSAEVCTVSPDSQVLASLNHLAAQASSSVDIPARTSSSSYVMGNSSPANSTRKWTNQSNVSSSGLTGSLLEDALSRLPKLSRDGSRPDVAVRTSTPSFENLLQRMQSMTNGHPMAIESNEPLDLAEVIAQSRRRLQHYRTQWDQIRQHESELGPWLRGQDSSTLASESSYNASTSYIKSQLAASHRNLSSVSSMHPTPLKPRRSPNRPMAKRYQSHDSGHGSTTSQPSGDMLVPNPRSDSLPTPGSSPSTLVAETLDLAGAEPALTLASLTAAAPIPVSPETTTDRSARAKSPQSTSPPSSSNREWNGLPLSRQKKRPAKLRQSRSPIALGMLDKVGSGTPDDPIKRSPTDAKMLLSSTSVTVNEQGEPIANPQLGQPGATAANSAAMPPLPPMKRMNPRLADSELTLPFITESANSPTLANAILQVPVPKTPAVTSAPVDALGAVEGALGNLSLDRLLNGSYTYSSEMDAKDSESIAGSHDDAGVDIDDMRLDTLRDSFGNQPDLAGYDSDLGIDINFDTGLDVDAFGLNPSCTFGSAQPHVARALSTDAAHKDTSQASHITGTTTSAPMTRKPSLNWQTLAAMKRKMKRGGDKHDKKSADSLSSASSGAHTTPL